jgi:outer membrane protein assembly factor BamD (BamD/ComL family)
MRKARENYSPVIFFVYTSKKKSYLAKACHKLNTTVFVDQKVVKLSKKFLCLATDFVHMHRTVQMQFKIRVVPTIIITDAFSNILYTLRGSTTPAAFERFMKTARKRNERAVNKYKARMASLEREFRKADALLDKGDFDAASKILDRMAKNKMDKDLAEGAKARMEEMKMGRLYIEGVKALEAKNFDLAKVKLEAVADSQIANRWSSRAWEIALTIPAAKMYHQALEELDQGKNYEAMQKLQKLTTMENAGAYAEKAQKKIEEIKRNWNKKVK